MASMKHVVIALVLSSLCACSGDEQSIRFLGAQRLDAQCKPAGGDTTFASDGSLDISVRNRYLISFVFQSTIETATTTVGGQPLAGSARGDAYVDSVTFAYSSDPAVAIPSETIPQYLVVHPGTNNNQFGLDLITPKALNALQTTLNNAGGSLTLLVSVTANGHIEYSGAKFTSNTITFPITVFNSGAPPGGNCTTATGTPGVLVDSAAGPCGSGGGQDGLVPTFQCVAT